MVKQTNSAKDKFIDKALELFSERGFEAVSLNDIASELGLTKQSILYHFKTKEALYAAVLEGLADRFGLIMDQVESMPIAGDEKWSLLLSALYDYMQTGISDARLIMRELLDNEERAAASHKWYLRDFLNQSTVYIAQTEKWKNAPTGEQRAAVYQAIGAINYLAISGATLSAIWGAEDLADLKKVYLDTLIDRHT
ncbi:TetR/AcrR family transcriptional regulator [Kordiimonas sp. SCSIO 12610]|uniref:TetR/AcrR family transcriptional regulator n=1 Tax=Kordiimonas sp. SCSIO 12610 TaxID=2829597 RepID=UPI00210BF563|nr:TetR/AcrR family transcriptional regulator [Kordiimonas sp. SCSIO 12610]UTW54491.1 TetR/AcrR family transcriptional regulator [Kordiimonas sp. SCSIO 12610]